MSDRPAPVRPPAEDSSARYSSPIWGLLSRSSSVASDQSEGSRRGRRRGRDDIRNDHEDAERRRRKVPPQDEYLGNIPMVGVVYNERGVNAEPMADVDTAEEMDRDGQTEILRDIFQVMSLVGAPSPNPSPDPSPRPLMPPTRAGD